MGDERDKISTILLTPTGDEARDPEQASCCCASAPREMSVTKRNTGRVPASARHWLYRRAVAAARFLAIKKSICANSRADDALTDFTLGAAKAARRSRPVDRAPPRRHSVIAIYIARPISEYDSGLSDARRNDWACVALSFALQNFIFFDTQNAVTECVVWRCPSATHHLSSAVIASASIVIMS